MTIIAHFRSFGVPTLVGDLLVSGSDNPGRPVHLPASRNINERIFLPPNFYVVGLSQKVVLLSEGFAIAWSGSYTQAQAVLSTLEPLRLVASIDPSYVRTAIDAIDNSLRKNLSLIALVASPTGCELIAFGVERPQDCGPITQIACAGSGKKTFRELLSQFSSNVMMASPTASLDDLRNSFDFTVLSALAGEEFASTIPLQRGWGGGFEVVRFMDGRLQKIGGQLSLNFFVSRERGGWSLWWVPNFRHLDYWENLTVVQAIEHEVDPSGNALPGRRDVFLVAPPGTPNPIPSNFVPPDIQAHEAVLSYILLLEQRAAVTYAAAYTQPVFQYDGPAGSSVVKVSFDAMFMDDMLAFLQQRLDERVWFGGASNRPV